MQENGPILRDLGHPDFGADPAETDVDAAVDAVVAFANEIEGL